MNTKSYEALHGKKNAAFGGNDGYSPIEIINQKLDLIERLINIKHNIGTGFSVENSKLITASFQDMISTEMKVIEELINLDK